MRSIKSYFVAFRVTPEWGQAIAEAARHDLHSMSDYCRVAVLARLRAAATPTPSAPARDRTPAN